MMKYTMPNFFIPSYFLMKFPQYSLQFGLVYAIINIFMGPLAAVSSGILSDKYASKKSTNYMANPYIIIAGNVVALPALLIAMTTNNFWLAVGLMSFKVLGFENWWHNGIIMVTQCTCHCQLCGILLPVWASVCVRIVEHCCVCGHFCV